MQKEYKARRSELMEHIGSKGAAIVSAFDICACNNEYSLCGQNSNFYYFTGFVEPDALAVIVPGRPQGEFVLFNREKDAAKELWEGACLGQEGACQEIGADQAFPIEEIGSILPDLFMDREKIYNIGSKKEIHPRTLSYLNSAITKACDESGLAPEVVNCANIVHEMRLIKSPGELALMNKAIGITAKGFLRAMQKCRPGMMEYELEAELLYEFMRGDSRYEAFKTIVGGGPNACTLHYSKNNKELCSGDLVLVDAGAKYENYCADVTRTFPVNGKFSVEQRAIYEIVLGAQLAVIDQVHPGVRFDCLQSTAERAITKGLVDLGLLKGCVDDLHIKQSFKPFFMHKVSHWIGLDAHDVGSYLIDDEPRIFKPGMVLTVEPGVYIGPDAAVDAKWRGIGVRIEDEVLVTEDGSDVLTKMIPKSVAEIEFIMGPYNGVRS